MRTRKLVQLEIEELSLVYAPNSPVVRGAVVVVTKGQSFLEDHGTLEVLRGLNQVVERLKLEAKERELAAALEQEAQARSQRAQRVRVRHYDNYEAWENSAAQVRRRNARAMFIAECANLSEYNRNKKSDYGK